MLKKKIDKLNLEIKELSVCEQDDDGNTTEKKILVLGSETYDPEE